MNGIELEILWSNLISIVISPAPAYAKMKAAEYPLAIPAQPVSTPLACCCPFCPSVSLTMFDLTLTLQS